MYFNEKMWDKFKKSCEKRENCEKLFENVKKYVETVEEDENLDYFSYKIDKLLTEMSQEEIQEAQNLVIETLLKDL